MALSKIRNDSLADTAVHGRRNIIINGAMQVAQRGTSFADIGSSTYALDRFHTSSTATGELAVTISQSSTSPDGFSNSMKLLATTAETTVAAGDRFAFKQRIEAQDLQHLQYGTANAKSLTLSFWVRSNVTGTYGVYVYLDDDGRILGSNYTISAADTWEYKTITFVGDTTGVIDNNTGVGMEIAWHLMAGSNFTGGTADVWGAYEGGKEAPSHNADWGEDANDDFYITGVQLEIGDTATPFEHRTYGEELALCQRYFYKTLGPIWFTRLSGATDYGRISYSFPTTMRATPTSTTSVSGTFSVSGNQYMTAQNMGLYVNNPASVNYLSTGATFDAEI